MMRNILIALLLIALTGCSDMKDQGRFLEPVYPLDAASLYRIRIEQSGTTRFVGLLALEPRTEGIWTILLDASGIPLIKGLIAEDGNMRLEYSVNARSAKKLPALLGRVIMYTYFTPASANCPWYDPYRVCFRRDDSVKTVKWRKVGPYRPWHVERQHGLEGKKTITITMNMQSVRVTLQDLAEEQGN